MLKIGNHDHQVRINYLRDKGFAEMKTYENSLCVGTILIYYKAALHINSQDSQTFEMLA